MTDPAQPHESREADSHGEPDDRTLAGYFQEHARPPAFGGPDGQPYTVSPEAELTPSLQGRYEGYLVFLRWAETGAGVLDHVETDTLVTGESSEAVLAELGRLTLGVVKELLDDAVGQRMKGPGDP